MFMRKYWGFPDSSVGKESSCSAGDLGSIPGLGRSPQERKTTHSSILAWRIPWTVQSMGLQRVRQNGVTFTFHSFFFHKEIVVLVFLSCKVIAFLIFVS